MMRLPVDMALCLHSVSLKKTTSIFMSLNFLIGRKIKYIFLSFARLFYKLINTDANTFETLQQSDL